ncbi:hypothetical protein BDM02DRAFT_3115049 [Thelephora ganbajun]|uniref:Uncharacterized protein n=1 Tax=Thelephora ganbajun TaxID=370292 RepID=A0ACB6ZH18_THEGA|nr:hypothetical protein BDM02DRAFT_3115049 [Thelephora ganbajun]
MLSTILGFSAFGFAARVGQLAIQQRPLFSNPAGHALAAVSFGTLGYFEYLWELRADELIALKREQIAQKRKDRTNPPPEA